MATTEKKKNRAKSSDKEQLEKGKDRRSGIERREYDYFSVIPERRSGNDRRKSDE